MSSRTFRTCQNKSKKLELKGKFLKKKLKIDQWLKLKDLETDIEKELEMVDKISDVDPPDYYGERGCCFFCDETTKENMAGLERDVWLHGKHYDCLCDECKCRFCLWYNSSERKCGYEGGE